MPRQRHPQFPPLTDEELKSVWGESHWALKFPPVLTVDQAAELLQVPKTTVYDWSSRGLLNGCARRVGKHLRIWRDRLLTSVFNKGIQQDVKCS